MNTQTRSIWIACACLLGLALTLCALGDNQIHQNGAISQVQLEKLGQAGPTLMLLLNNLKVLPKGNKKAEVVAQEIFDLLKDPLKLQVDENAKDMEDLDLVTLMRRKYGSPRDIALLFAALLQTCEIPTAILPDGKGWLLLFRTDADTSQTVEWQKKTWGVVAIPTNGWGNFTDAQKQGQGRYRQRENVEASIYAVYSHWHWNSDETVETLLRKGIDHGQRGELEDAQKCFEGVLKLDPQNATAMNNLGNLYLFRQEIDKAIQYYKEALKLSPNDSAIHLNRGVAYYQKWAKSTTQEQRQEFEKAYQGAFDEAYRGVQNGLNLCRYLGIDSEDPTYQRYCWLIYEAERRVTKKEPQWKPVGGRGRQSEVPVYWKSF
ncbi:tetratricopeptide repeat protein [Candidatus Poribacteria bacterium]|nr:tetratricopeptide repeat protein [Candidatus Poribacteria bacterium]